MKYWVVKEQGNFMNWVVIGSSKRPKEESYPAPLDPITGKPEDSRWIQVENIEVEDGVFKKMATVNQVLKDQLLFEDSVNNEKNKSDKKKRDDRLKEAQKELNKFDKHRVVGLEQIQDRLDDIVVFLRENFGFKDK